MSRLGKMTIVAFSDDKYTNQTGKPYIFMLNPEEFSEKTEINYDLEQAPGSIDADAKFKSTKPSNLDLNIVIDCTGVVDSERTNLQVEIDRLKEVCLSYDGKIHRPKFIAIYWGSFSFKGVLQTLDIKYTYFKPDGSPLRAKVTLGFVTSTNANQMTKKRSNSSPDLTHIVNIGTNNLPQISQDIYDDPHLYIQLAKFNKLDKFRNLKSDRQIVVPPLISTETQHSS